MLDLLTSLLKPTIENALKTEFYKDIWTPFQSVLERLTDSSSEDQVQDLFQDLPFVSKDEIRAAGDKARVLDGQVIKERFTSGSTGAPFVFAFGQRERAAEATFYKSFWGDALDREKRRIVRIMDPHTTAERRALTPTRFHDVGLYKRGSFSYLLDHVISRTWREDQVEDTVTAISASERVLRAFTEAARVRHTDGFENPIQYLYTSSSLLTPEARTDYETFWGGQVIDRYGLSETFGGATQYPDGWYMFDPTLFPEVVSADSRTPLKEGVGMMVLTPLFPFQEVQPLVRYWTGDVVEVTHTRSSLHGRLAIRPLGRACDGLFDETRKAWILTPDVVFRALEDRMDIDRAPMFLDSRQVVDHDRVGLPLRRLARADDAGGHIIRLYVSAKGEPSTRRATLTSIENTIRSLAPVFADESHYRFEVKHSDDPEGQAGPAGESAVRTQ